MSKSDPLWIMPSLYYFKKFERKSFNICVWFLDTQNFDKKQSDWFQDSLQTEKPGCHWLVVNGHHPTSIHASGISFANKHLDKWLQPILDKHDVHLYLCGHHHNSQVLENSPAKTKYFVVGQMSFKHSVGKSPRKGQLVWNYDQSPAYLVLEFSSTIIKYEFIDGSSTKPRTVLYSNTVPYT